MRGGDTRFLLIFRRMLLTYYFSPIQADCMRNRFWLLLPQLRRYCADKPVCVPRMRFAIAQLDLPVSVFHGYRVLGTADNQGHDRPGRIGRPVRIRIAVLAIFHRADGLKEPRIRDLEYDRTSMGPGCVLTIWAVMSRTYACI
jgi:hypothetical protein